jgi:hypothetical protein
MKIVMVMYVRDEEDVLEANLRAHLALGVDRFVVIDHRSTDRTPEILRRYQEAGFVDLLGRDESEPSESEGFKHMERKWGTELARRAATEHGADWVLHADADEFWWPLAEDLKAALAKVPERYSALIAPRVEFVARPDGPGEFWERLTVRERFSRVRPKIAHRGHPEADLPSGAHQVAIPGAEGPPHVGRASLRAGEDRFAGSNRWTPPAPVWPLRVFHFPVRSLDHFARRVELALFVSSGRAQPERARQLLEAYEQDRLDDVYSEVAYDDQAVAAGIGAGELVGDTRLRDLLAACPDPVTDPRAIAGFRPVPPGADHREELDELAQDAMQAMSRAEALNEIRAEGERERVEQLRERVNHHAKRARRQRQQRQRLQRRMRAMRSTRWFRLGQRLSRMPLVGRLLGGGS